MEEGSQLGLEPLQWLEMPMEKHYHVHHGEILAQKREESPKESEGSISPRLKDVAGATEALDEGGNTFTAASTSSQRAEQRAQHALYHGGEELRGKALRTQASRTPCATRRGPWWDRALLLWGRGWGWRWWRGWRGRLCCLQEVTHALEKGRDAGHCHGDGGRSHARPSRSWPCRPQQIPQKLRELQISCRRLRGWRLGRPPGGRASCGSCVGGASTG